MACADLDEPTIDDPLHAVDRNTRLCDIRRHYHLARTGRAGVEYRELVGR